MSRTSEPYAPRVKGSKQERLVLVPHHPVRRVFVQICLILAYFAIATASYFSGQWVAVMDQQDASTERDKLMALTQTLQDQVSKQRDELVFFQQGTEVERQAVETLRKENKKLLDRIAELEEATAHYQRVLTPDKEDDGLVIGRLELKPTAVPNRYRYNFNLIQVSGKTRVQGQAFVKVMGMEAGIKTEKLLQDLTIDAEEMEENGIKLGFRNYQAIGGELILPDGFTPEQVEIVAQFTGRKAVRLRKVYDWSVQEMSSDVGQG